MHFTLLIQLELHPVTAMSSMQANYPLSKLAPLSCTNHNIAAHTERKLKAPTSQTILFLTTTRVQSHAGRTYGGERLRCTHLLPVTTV